MPVAQIANNFTLNKTLVGGAFLSLQPLVLNVITVPVMAYIIRRLGPQAYGQWAIAASLLAVGAMLTNLGLRGSFVRAVAKDASLARSALADQLGLRLLLMLLSASGVMTACWVMGYPSVVLACAAVGAVAFTFSTVATTFSDLLQSLGRLKTIATINLAAGLTLTVVSLIVAWLRPSAVTITASYVVGPVVSLLLLGFVCARECPIGVQFNFGRFTKLLKESRYLAAQQMLAAASVHAEALILPALVGFGNFGLFAAGSLLATRLTALPDGLCTAAYPGIARACAVHPAYGRLLVLRYVAIAVGLCAVLAIAGALLAGPIAHLLFPRQSELCATVIRVTVWALPLFALESVIGYSLNAAGKDAAQARASLPAAIFSLALAAFLAWQGGVIGAAWSMMLRPGVRACCLAPVFFRTFWGDLPEPLRLHARDATPAEFEMPARKAG